MPPPIKFLGRSEATPRGGRERPRSRKFGPLSRKRKSEACPRNGRAPPALHCSFRLDRVFVCTESSLNSRHFRPNGRRVREDALPPLDLRVQKPDKISVGGRCGLEPLFCLGRISASLTLAFGNVPRRRPIRISSSVKGSNGSLSWRDTEKDAIFTRSQQRRK